MAARSQASTVIASPGFQRTVFNEIANAVAERKRHGHQLWMRVEPFIVGSDRPGVLGVSPGWIDEPRHHFTVPQHVVGDQQPAGAKKLHQAIQGRHVERLVAVLEDQVEGPGDLREHPLRIADEDADTIREPCAGKVLAGESCPIGISPIVRSMPPVGRARASQMPE